MFIEVKCIHGEKIFEKLTLGRLVLSSGERICELQASGMKVPKKEFSCCAVWV
jgi:hypothetical protein